MPILCNTFMMTGPRLLLLLLLSLLCLSDQAITSSDCKVDSECFNGGTCVKGNASAPSGIQLYNCVCTDLWSGTNCQTPYVPCPDKSLCYNGGICILPDIATNNYACKCPPDVSGDSCSAISGSLGAVLGKLEQETGLSGAQVFGVVVACIGIVVGAYIGMTQYYRRKGYEKSADSARRETNEAFEMDVLSVDHNEMI